MKKFLLAMMMAFVLSPSFAINPPDEGMWLPMFIKGYNYSEMQRLGLKLTAEQLYDINNSSLKDAIVQLGDGFCTGEIVSRDGLMFTNHHCGYSFIVDHSTTEHDYLKNGFWAMSREEELPNEGFHVNMLEYMQDVTATVLAEVTADMKESQRRDHVTKAINKLKEEHSKEGRYNVVIKPFYEGNEYYMFVYTTYKDIRLVGAPPSAVGKFGGDTDNWMWPRHTGDFTIFRIYTAPDGSPAEYSPENIPLKPKHYLPISTKGVKMGDFSMVWGYPGTTERFMTSYEVAKTINIDNPSLVEPFDQIIPVYREEMNKSDRVRLLYADDFASWANTWKNKQGETNSLIALRVKEKKEKQEEILTNWINADESRKEKYGDALPKIKAICEGVNANEMKTFWYANVVLMSSKTVMLPYSFRIPLPDIGQKKVSLTAEDVQQLLKEYDESYGKIVDLPTEEKVLVATLQIWNNVPEENQPSIIKYAKETYKKAGTRWAEAFAADVMEKSIFTSRERLEKFLSKSYTKKMYDEDLLVKYNSSLIQALFMSQSTYRDASTKINLPRRSYLAAIREMEQNKPMYPDANSTMRVTYGQVLDYYPIDGVHYLHYTTAQGILEKEIPNDPEFDVPAKLKTLIETKDFGPYAENGVLPVCFLSNNDITGGNSGSPVINANGELIGLAFDGNWEALSSDIVFNTELQRCINVDVRYVLFIIDKYAGAGYLLKEMDLR